MRIETHHIFKVSVFATHVKIKYFLLKILFPKYCIKGFFTYNIIFFKIHRSTPVGVAPSGSIVRIHRINSLNHSIPPDRRIERLNELV